MTQTTVHGTLEYHPMARPQVELAHLRNVGYGCYNFAVRVTGELDM